MTTTRGSCPDHPHAEYCEHGGVKTGNVPRTYAEFRAAVPAGPEIAYTREIGREEMAPEFLAAYPNVKTATIGYTIGEYLEYLRGELRAERISYGGLAELADLAPYIAPGDVELLEPAGVPDVLAYMPIAERMTYRDAAGDWSIPNPPDKYGDVRDRMTERELAEILIGPTSGENARRLAAWAYGRGPEYDAKPIQVRWTYPEESSVPE